MRMLWEVKLFGLKLKRYQQWLQVVKEAGRTMPYHVMIGQMYRAIRRTSRDNKVRRRLWRAHIKTCSGCVLYEPRVYRCGLDDQPSLGCRCYMPFKAAAPGPCWIKQQFPNSPFGYEE